ncbi:tRNA-specific adenosine deaminase [Grosmannia clavigera kw1407]|uniref:tRNA-specific adenosine deaminase n=1 Tax=Grosmannia clavigera (strain kw1407 / UAMH 11150) TaxID=655863 RepID=F0XBU0_GROCL|nr:tRNA-specific adenosine deaminase [Grosmannia clavigera kw1407]EFX05013.1 tRNA-specific adenosine deaminase [Grosmannia clavigera kw1407]
MPNKTHHTQNINTKTASTATVTTAAAKTPFTVATSATSTTAKAITTTAIKTIRLAAIPLRPFSALVPKTSSPATDVELKAPALAAAVVTDGVSHEKNRRARRAERAVLIFREQRQKQQAEDAARRERSQTGGLYPAPSLGCSSDSVLSPSSAESNGKKTKNVHFHTGPANLTANRQTLISTVANCASPTASANTVIALEKTPSSKKMLPTPSSELAEVISVAGFGQTMDSGVDQGVVASMKRKSDIALMGSDAEEGNESDESNASFIMTRTAGKRRGNLSSGDMLANEILHDINEDLNTMAEEAEECDPIKRLHRGYMNEAVAMAQLALRTNETPVGCVLVHNGRVIAKGMNATNMTRNGTRHAELMCLNALLAQWDDVSDVDSRRADDSDCDSAQDYDNDTDEFTDRDWARVNPSKGHLFPYGQKLHPARVVNPDIVRGCSLYVTVEPCIMCASMLRQYGIKKVYFGAANDKFGGTGGVLRIHMNSKPNEPAAQNATYIETYVTNMMSKPRRTRTVRQPLEGTGGSTSMPSDKGMPADSSSELDGPPMNNPPIVRRASTIPIAEGSVPARDSGHGGNVEPGFDVEGGWGRDKAVFLLRQFYVQENGRAPAPRKKEGRAQRLVEQMKSESSSSVKLPSSVSGHQAEMEVELDSLPLEASSPSRPVEGPLGSMEVDMSTENALTD